MRLPAAIVLSVVSAGLGAGLVACIDLFHSTSGILDACELDAASCTEALPDLCAWEAGTASANAALACTWLNKCEGTFEYDFGECMVRARFAYDCNVVVTNNGLTSATKQAWLDLLQAKSCDDVHLAMFRGGRFTCPADAGAALGCDDVTRFSCSEGGALPYGDSCALWNETCNANGGCVGCLGCVDAGDAGPCTPDASATCMGDIAISCPSGVLEAIDCNELLQQPGTCNSGPLPQALDPTSACYFDAGATDAGGCVETCNANNSLTACPRGTTLNVDCAGTIDAACAGGNGGPASCVFQ
jgi:hypothetical protein